MIVDKYNEDYGLVQYIIYDGLIQTLKMDASQLNLKELIIVELQENCIKVLPVRVRFIFTKKSMGL